MKRQRREPGDVCAIFVHAGAGFHSFQNEKMHLLACSDATKVGMTLLKNGGEAVDAVELAIKVLEDREITNSGFGSNLSMEGVVECDATIVDHYGRSGAVGAVSQIKNPISLARTILDYSTKPLLLQRVPPNLLVAQGAIDFAFDHGVPVLPQDFLISRSARERWIRWKQDLKNAERRGLEMGPEEMEVEYERKREPLEIPRDDIYSSTTSPHSINASSANESGGMAPPIPPLAQSTADSPQSSTTVQINDYMEESAEPHSESLSRNYLVPSPLKQVMAQGNDGSIRLQFAAALDQGHQYMDVGSNESRTQTTNSAINFHRGRTSYDGSSESDSKANLGTQHLCSQSRPSSSSDVCDRLSRPKSVSVAASESDSSNPTQSLSFSSWSQPAINALLSDGDHRDGKNREDIVTDTVGCIAVDCYGNIAAGSSSGGIGMKHRGRTGPAALVGVGTAVIPMDADDPDRMSVACVTSGTGEHMATTLAAATCADRVYSCVRKKKGGLMEACTEDEAMQGMIENEFMNHPGVRNSHCVGAIGVMTVKKTRDGVYLYFAHNTDSFAIASMSGEDKKPVSTMSRNEHPGMTTTGGRAAKWRGNRY